MSSTFPWRGTISTLRRSLCEAVGIARYSRPALNRLDGKLERYLDFDGGFFVEAGANDGFQQSNTYYFERMRGWRGVLIEPLPELAERCKRLRRSSIVVQAALVGPDYPDDEVEMARAGLMSMAQGAMGDEAAFRRHLERAREQGQCDPGGIERIRVPATTLARILAREVAGKRIDLLSLDIEGGELAALAGLDLARQPPAHICVEARDPAAVRRFLDPYYESVAVLSDNGEHQDLFFRLR